MPSRTQILINILHMQFFFYFSQNGRWRPFWMTKNHFRSHFSSLQINTQLLISLKFFHKMAGAILDDRISLSIAFSSFQINMQFLFSNCFCKIATGDHFKWPKITFDHISRHFRSIRNFIWNLFTKGPPPAILDDRKSPLIAFIAISDQYAAFLFFYKMAAGSHFGWPKITFDRISRHFRSIRNFFFWNFFLNGRRRPFWVPIFVKIDRDLPL